MKKVLVTGVNGFIGSHLADYYVSQGMQVVGIDRVGKGMPCCKTLDMDITRDSLGRMLGKECPDVIVNCAGLADVSRSIRSPQEDYEANVTAVHRLLFELNRAELKHTRFIQLSSAAVYGQPSVLPISETAPRRPLSPYALHKMMAEDICMYANDVYGIPVKVLRIFSTYGPGLSKQVFWDMAQKLRSSGRITLYGSGKETRDYIYISDLVRAIDLIVRDNSGTVFFNVANGGQDPLEHVAKIFLKEKGESTEKLTFSHVKRDGDPLYWQADITRLRNLGYAPAVDIKSGIHNYVLWLNGTEGINLKSSLGLINASQQSFTDRERLSYVQQTAKGNKSIQG